MRNRPKLLNPEMVKIIKQRKKKKKIKIDKELINSRNGTNNGNFFGVLILCIAVISFYIRSIIISK